MANAIIILEKDNLTEHNEFQSEFEQIIESYSNLIEYDDDMFNNNLEELDKDYVSDEDDLDEIRQFDCKNLEINKIIDFKAYL
ncbi:15564_t:CDS:2 [Cetraspora pellucida]|uniref:15564_t:CDS:1 n=1 Tax=Cetraspora pellucida TaxID=1433469 RepID=A0A9N9K4L4_9GLOM|nr:15564_t:CDS:2 [Cetraspora pellucida]